MPSLIPSTGYFVAFYAIGICTGYFLGTNYRPLAYPFYLSISGIVIIGLLHCRKHNVIINLDRLVLSLLVFATSFLAGLFAIATTANAPDGILVNDTLLSTTISIAGVVESVEVMSSNATGTRQHQTVRYRTVLQVRRAYHRGTVYPVSDRMLATVWDKGITPRPGHYVMMSGTMQQPLPRRNPADMDYRAHLARQRIHAVFKVHEWTHIGVPTTVADRFRNLVYLSQFALRQRIDRYIPSSNARAISQALLLGDRGGLQHETTAAFRASGLAHLLAVSGLHVACIGLVLYNLLRPLLLRIGMGWRTAEWVRVLATMALLSGYMIITGAKPSIVRAVIMVGCMVSVSVLQRPRFVLNSLSVAALILLAVAPNQLLDAGFQLSFAAVLGIVVLFPAFRAMIPRALLGPRILKSVLESVLVSVAAFLSTLPIVLFHFGSASGGGLLLNIAAIPVTMGLLFSGLLTVFASFWLPTLAITFGHTTDILAHALLQMVHFGASIQEMVSIQRYMAGSDALLYCMALAGALWGVNGRPSPLIKTFLVALLIITVALWLTIARSPKKDTLSVLFFDVGHGDATLIELPNGKRLVIDTGSAPSPGTHSSLMRHLSRYPTPCVDAVLLTHPHADHDGGLPALADQHCIRRLYRSIPSTSMNQGAHEDARMLAAGDTLQLDPSVRIRILSPSQVLLHAVRQGHASVNDASLVVAIEYGTVNMIFMGDAERVAEERIIAAYPEFLASGIVKVGHHGSMTSSMDALVRAVFPDQALQDNADARYAVISSDRNGAFNLPHQTIVQRWRDQGGNVHLTAQEGALWLYTDGHSIYSREWR